MKIVFTQFTPPFEHGLSEIDYLQYDDWYSKLRRAFAKTDEVFFISLTKEKRTIEIKRDGYTSIFFPVKNPQDRQRAGKLWYESDEICPWLLKFKPDVIHLVGTGSEMAVKILETVYEPVRFLWERCTVNENTLNWKELNLCDYYIHPTTESIERAAVKIPRQKLLKVPLGADCETFRPLEIEKQFDIVTVGRLTPSKGFDNVQEIVNRRGYSWIHAGGFVKKAPYSFIEDKLFLRKLRQLFVPNPIKKSSSGKIWSGRFTHRMMPEVYNMARVMVHPSIAEGAARAVQEAIGCQLPVIARREAVPWIEPEFGIAVDDISELDGAISGLLSSTEKRTEMGRKGREWLLENHSFEHLLKVVDKFNRMKKFHN